MDVYLKTTKKVIKIYCPTARQGVMPVQKHCAVAATAFKKCWLCQSSGNEVRSMEALAGCIYARLDFRFAFEICCDVMYVVFF